MIFAVGSSIYTRISPYARTPSVLEVVVRLCHPFAPPILISPQWQCLLSTKQYYMFSVLKTTNSCSPSDSISLHNYLIVVCHFLYVPVHCLQRKLPLLRSADFFIQCSGFWCQPWTEDCIWTPATRFGHSKEGDRNILALGIDDKRGKYTLWDAVSFTN